MSRGKAAPRYPSCTTVPVASPPAPLADRIEALARRVGRLGRGARGPEDFIVAKMTLAAELRALARETKP